jgi:hypothetical protein
MTAFLLSHGFLLPAAALLIDLIGLGAASAWYRHHSYGSHRAGLIRHRAPQRPTYLGHHRLALIGAAA